MTKSEVVKVFMAIAKLFPRDTAFIHADKEMVNMWHEMLEDIPFDHAMAAVKASVATSPFPPSIAEIRDYATRLTGPRRLTAEEAWGIASECIREYGLRTVPKEGFAEKRYEFVRLGEPVRVHPSGVEYEAKRHCPEDVWSLLQRMGYADIVKSDNPDVIRGQFMKAWSSHDTEAKEVRVIGGVVPELVAAITNTVLAQLGAGDE